MNKIMFAIVIGFLLAVGFHGMFWSMSNPNEAGDTKGAIAAFLIIAFIMVGTPVIIGTWMGWFNLFGILGL